MKKHKWRVIIIMSHDGDSYFEYNDLEQSILDQEKFENLSYYFLYHNQKYDRISIKEARIEPDRRFLREIPKAKEITKGSFYDKNTLLNFFKHVKALDNANDHETEYHYFVITLGHGGGLFLFPSDEIEKLLKVLNLSDEKDKTLIGIIKNKLQENIQLFTQMPGDTSSKRASASDGNVFPFLPVEMFSNSVHLAARMNNRAIGNEIDNINRVISEKLLFYTAADLNEAFKDGLQKRVDVYFALNCFTQMIETGYELMESVDMMVAPQTSIPLTGINYTEVFATLEERPDISQKELAEVFVSSYDRKYSVDFIKKFHTRYPRFDPTNISFSCNRLAGYVHLLDCLNDLTRLIKRIYTTPAHEAYIRNVSVARKLCGDLSPDNNYGIIDLNNFLIQLQHRLPDEFIFDITIIREAFENVKDQQVLQAIKNPGTDVTTAPGKPVDNPLCLSFFAPAMGSSDAKDFLLKIYSRSNGMYGLKSEWKDFVLDFYGNTIAILP
jgi:hypothetical protein